MERTVAPFYKGWRPAAAPSGAEPLEPGAEATPFTDPGGEGWEDDDTHPRRAEEVVGAPAAGHRSTRGSPCSCGSSRTTRITVARCRRRWAVTGSGRSTSGPASRGSRP